jgi:plastocyanin
MRKALLLVALIALVATSCSSKNTGTAASPAASSQGPQTFSVVLDGKTDAFNGEFGTFFPDGLSAHAGDTIKWSFPRTSGVPHTVTLGTLVDKAVAKYVSFGQQTPQFTQENDPDVLNLPDLFPHVPPKQFPPDANQSAAQPCFLASGVAPLSLSGSAQACPKTTQPDFDGTQSFYNSGALVADGDSFTMKLASTIKPATYSVICLIHRGGMTAKLTVAPASQTIPTPADVTASGTKQFSDVVTRMTPIAQAAQVTSTTTTAVSVGSFDTQSDNVIADFGPKSISVPVNSTVTFTFAAFHTLSLNSPDSKVGVVTKDPTGAVHLTPGGAPVGWNVPLYFGFFPPPLTQTAQVVPVGSYAGSGEKSTGIVGSLPPQIFGVAVKFTQKGTVPIRCLIHPEMKGEVKVG